MQQPLKKFVVVVDESLAPGEVANTVLHLGTQFGAIAPAVAGGEVRDASGESHSGLPVWPNVVLSAPASELRKRVAAAKISVPKGDVILLDYPREGQTTTTDEEYRLALGKIEAESIEYYACLLFGDRRTINKLTGGLPLWGRSHSSF